MREVSSRSNCTNVSCTNGSPPAEEEDGEEPSSWSPCGEGVEEAEAARGRLRLLLRRPTRAQAWGRAPLPCAAVKRQGVTWQGDAEVFACSGGILRRGARLGEGERSYADVAAVVASLARGVVSADN